MDGLDAINEMNELTRSLAEGIDELRLLGRRYAEAERTYRVEKAKAIRTLRAEGVPVTIILDLAGGHTAQWRFDRDTAEIMWKTQQEHINGLKLRIKILEAQIAREWGR